MKKTQASMNKSVYLGLSILELSNRVVHEIWYYYIKPKYGEKSKMGYMDTNSFIIYIKADDIYKGIAEDVETRIDTLNYELDRTLPKGKK